MHNGRIVITEITCRGEITRETVAIIMSLIPTNRWQGLRFCSHPGILLKLSPTLFFWLKIVRLSITYFTLTALHQSCPNLLLYTHPYQAETARASSQVCAAVHEPQCASSTYTQLVQVPSILKYLKLYLILLDLPQCDPFL